MNIVTAIDSFRGSLTSLQAGNAAAEGIRRVYPDAEYPGAGAALTLIFPYYGLFAALRTR